MAEKEARVVTGAELPGAETNTSTADLIRVFEYLGPMVREQACLYSDGARIPAPNDDVWAELSDCLAHGLVPSAILLRGTPRSIQPSVILNAGYFFWRERIDSVLTITSGRSADNIADRAWITSRVEEWTLKAIDDVLNWPDKRPKPKSGISTAPSKQLQPNGVIPWETVTATWKKTKLWDVDTVVVTPVAWAGIDADSIDLRLGPRFVLSRPHRIASIDFGQKGTEKPLEYLSSQELIHIPNGEDIIIPPHGTVLGATLEFIKLPYNMSGQVLTKSSLARRFITIETAPWIHPLYRGCLTLEIANTSGVSVRIPVGKPIAQLVLFALAGVERPDTDRIDQYAGPTYPELDPASDA